MKKLFIAFLLLSGGFVSAQDYSVPVRTTAECKAAEPEVLLAANLIMSKPLKNPEAKKAESFVLTWMTNCEYTFELGGNITKLNKKENAELLFVYMACQAKFVLENPSKAKDTEAITLAAYSALADYVAVAANGVKQTKEVKRLIEAKEAGTMKEYAAEK
ncbi:MAG: hypothetical protein M3R17_11270 [Bacteroidota bacterium]|nr:hypothetical protein [Bacteroidota bacterium]